MAIIKLYKIAIFDYNERVPLFVNNFNDLINHFYEFINKS